MHNDSNVYGSLNCDTFPQNRTNIAPFNGVPHHSFLEYFLFPKHSGISWQQRRLLRYTFNCDKYFIACEKYFLIGLFRARRNIVI